MERGDRTAYVRWTQDPDLANPFAPLFDLWASGYAVLGLREKSIELLLPPSEGVSLAKK